MDEVLIVFTSCPDAEIARRIGTTLVEQRLAACVNVLTACTSIYRWHGTVETAAEVPILIKTHSGLYERLQAAIRDHVAFYPDRVDAIVLED